MILRSVDHPNIVKLYEIYLDHRYLHIVTEMLDGGPIRPEKALRKKLSEAEAARIIRQSLQALNYLHQLNIVHRDLKTDNMLYCKNKKFVKLIDFGLAKFCHKTPELDGIKGTPYFMSPEMIKGDKYDKRTDLWSMGVITYLLLTGRMPFLGNEAEDLDEAILTTNYHFDEKMR